MPTRIITLIFAVAIFPGAIRADYACMLEEQPICRLFSDRGGIHREKLDALCLKAPGKPVNRCPARAVFSCTLNAKALAGLHIPGESMTEYSYRATALSQVKQNCVSRGGVFGLIAD